jgi:hypothetical protein
MRNIFYKYKNAVMVVAAPVVTTQDNASATLEVMNENAVMVVVAPVVTAQDNASATSEVKSKDDYNEYEYEYELLLELLSVKYNRTILGRNPTAICEWYQSLIAEACRLEINLAQFIKNRKITPPLPLHQMSETLIGAFYDPTLNEVVSGEKLVLEMLSLGLIDNKIPEFWKVGDRHSKVCDQYGYVPAKIVCKTVRDLFVYTVSDYNRRYSNRNRFFDYLDTDTNNQNTTPQNESLKSGAMESLDRQLAFFKC